MGDYKEKWVFLTEKEYTKERMKQTGLLKPLKKGINFVYEWIIEVEKIERKAPDRKITDVDEKGARTIWMNLAKLDFEPLGF
jgi:hypothetical protein